MTFSQFYQSGGLFMHFITLFAVAGAVSIARRAAALRRPPGEARLPPSDGGLAPWLCVAGVLAGVGGTVMGLIEVSAALQTVALEHWPRAVSRGVAMAVIPLGWAALVMAPVFLAHGVLRSFESRIRAAMARARRAGSDPTAA